MRHSTRRAYLLGEFDLMSRMRIYLDAHATSEHLHYTESHELAHRSLATSTTHGHVQQLLARVIAASRYERTVPWASKASTVLDEILDASWTVDEGYAVFAEFDFQRRHAIAADPAPMGTDYRSAYELITRPLPQLDRTFQGFERLVVRALAEVALNTTVLREAPFDDHFADVLSALMRDPAFRPDDRLRRLVGALSRDPFTADLGRLVHQQVLESAIAHGLPADAPAPEVYRRAHSLATTENLDFLEDVDRRLTGPLEQALAGLCPELEFVTATGHEVRAGHASAGRAYAEHCGLEMPDYLPGTHAERALARADLEYEVSNPLTTTHIPHPLAGGLAVETLVELHGGFIVTVEPAAADPIKGVKWLTLMIMPLERVPGTPAELDHWRLTGERMRVYGPPPLVEEWCRRLRSRVNVLLLGPGAVSFENWTVDPAVDALRPLPVCVFPYSTGTWLLALLREWMATGVRSIAPIRVTADRIAHLLVRLPTGTDMVVRVPLYLMGVLRVHYPEVHAFLMGEMKRTEGSLPPRAFLDLLVGADLAGGFLPARETDAAIFIAPDDGQPHGWGSSRREPA